MQRDFGKPIVPEDVVDASTGAESVGVAVSSWVF